MELLLLKHGNGSSLEKVINIIPNKTYTVSVVTSDGKISLKKVRKSASELIPLEYGDIYFLCFGSYSKDLKERFPSEYENFSLSKNFICGIRGSGSTANKSVSSSSLTAR